MEGVGSVEGISGVIETPIPTKHDSKAASIKEETMLLESLKIKLQGKQSSPEGEILV